MRKHLLSITFILGLVGILAILSSTENTIAQNPGTEQKIEITQSTDIIREKGILESADTLMIRCPFPVEDRVSMVAPHGSVVNKDDPLLGFYNVDDHYRLLRNSIVRGVDEQRQKVLKAHLELQSAEKEKEMLENFEFEFSNRVKEEEKVNAARAFENARLAADTKSEAFKRRVASLEEKIALVEQQLSKEPESTQVSMENRLRLLDLKEQLASARDARGHEVLTQQEQMAILTLKLNLTDLELQKYRKGDYPMKFEQLELRIQGAKEALRREQDKYEFSKSQAAEYGLGAPREGVVVHQIMALPQGPFTGIQIGDEVHQDQILMTMPDLEQLQVRIAVHESNILSVKPGQDVTIRFVALPEKEFSGTVTSIADFMRPELIPGKDESRYEVLIQVNDPVPELKLGMTCAVGIKVGD